MRSIARWLVPGLLVLGLLLPSGTSLAAVGPDLVAKSVKAQVT